jgi:DNA modification methylase
MKNKLLSVRLEDIYFPTKLRLREDYGPVEELAQSLVRRGQIQPIVLRPFDEEEFPNATPHLWTLVDGGRRMFATMIVYKNEKEIPNVAPGEILAVPREEIDPMFALEIEFHANEDRQKFHWKEKIAYITRVHAHFRALDSAWDVKNTANLIQLGERATYAYLQMAGDPELLTHEKVQKQKSFRVAYKQFQILREERDRKSKIIPGPGAAGPLDAITREVQSRRPKSAVEAEKKAAAGIEEKPERAITGAKNLIKQGDCRDWIKQFNDEQFAWFHWDPPYGHRQGERMSIHGSIQDDQEYAHELMEAMIPEIYRTLQAGHWLVIWHHPAEYQWLRDRLTGHERTTDEDGRDVCRFCAKSWKKRPAYCPACPPARGHFWVNPYPCIWHKQRASDGHEIKRFLINDHEQFLLAAKVTGSKPDPILPNTDRSNVFTVPTLGRADRRHVTHKPVELLAEILDVVSYRGELGCDPSVGSGSIIEAALLSGRMAVGCELDEAYYFGAVEAVQNILDGTN